MARGTLLRTKGLDWHCGSSSAALDCTGFTEIELRCSIVATTSSKLSAMPTFGFQYNKLKCGDDVITYLYMYIYIYINIHKYISTKIMQNAACDKLGLIQAPFVKNSALPLPLFLAISDAAQ